MEGQGNKIRILDKDTINKIAAGEVIERPASAIKELVDNAIDAGATEVRIEVEKGGKKSILVRDNGCGMSRADALLAYEKHATSKLTKIEDLDTVATMGFRGEALSSITAIAKVEILTRPPEELAGTKVLIHGGQVQESSNIGTAPGTAVHVKDLFYNTPARQKYLKSDKTELAHITEVVMKLALANPEISFTLLSDGKPVLRNPASSELLNSVVNLLGPETARSMLPVESLTGDVVIRGCVSKPELTRGTGDQLFLFVNTRPVSSKAVNAAIRQGYYTKIPKGRYPVAVLSLTLDPQEVDVNVHPRKAEVRFSREKEISNAVTAAVEKTLSEHGLAPEIREKEGKTHQKTLEVREPESRVLIHEKTDVSEKPENGPGKDIGRAAEVPAGGSKLFREKPETYSYPVKDTERRLKRSERLLGITSENEMKEAGKEKEEEKATREERKEKGTEEKTEEERKEKGTQKGIEKGTGEGNGKGTEKRVERAYPEQKPNKKANTDPLEDLRIIGQVSKIYILAEKGEDLVIIDQHAAHERVLYEQILKMKKNRVQELITPITIDLTPKEKVLMEEYIPYLEEHGFGISEFGDNTYVVTFVPDVFGRLEDPGIIHDLISELLAGGKIKKDTGVSEQVCKTMACRAAIKGGAACSLRQMEELVEQLKQAENPYSCPHGRPTVLTFTRGELDRMFARIQ
ncbi:DNA mismatch repair protein MutL [Methanosarcina sp. MTP4]|uniref:DNA mismatch repair endonuclease MutL n=1 Tax=Methanosarcina sp. MTP4 TaxID=1434100 RepID=UPI00061557AF|nr:DNA mismatch repair endonuclease MutL [Methanosarcina sp. MTP4]AKB26389.1 DNA mismatch repair protein MutL [Methanosarcina sp. MTP4]